MVQSIGNSIFRLIITRLDNRRILQLYFKVMPCVVECLQTTLQDQHSNKCPVYRNGTTSCLQVLPMADIA